MNLVEKLNGYRLPAFDYAALGSPEVEQQLRASATRIREMQRTSIVDIGRELIAVKERLDHGKFLDWIESEFAWSRRTAVNMMQAASEFGAKWEMIAHLPATAIYRLAAPSTPPEVREAVLKMTPDRPVSVRGVEAAIEATKASETRKKRRDRRAAYHADSAEREARQDAERAKARAEQAERCDTAEHAAERLRFMLGGYFPEFCDIFGTVDRYEFSIALERLAKQSRASRTGGAE